MKKTLITFAALSSLAAGMAAAASTAEAKVHVNLNIGLPGIGFGPGYYDSGYGYDDSPDCGWVYGPVVRWRHGHQVVVYKNHWVCG
jgi:hypothetical protein